MRRLTWENLWAGDGTWTLRAAGKQTHVPPYKNRACIITSSPGALTGALWVNDGGWRGAVTLPDTGEEALANMKQILMTMCRLGMDDGP